MFVCSVLFHPSLTLSLQLHPNSRRFRKLLQPALIDWDFPALSAGHFELRFLTFAFSLSLSCSPLSLISCSVRTLRTRQHTLTIDYTPQAGVHVLHDMLCTNVEALFSSFTYVVISSNQYFVEVLRHNPHLRDAFEDAFRRFHGHVFRPLLNALVKPKPRVSCLLLVFFFTQLPSI